MNFLSNKKKVCTYLNVGDPLDGLALKSNGCSPVVSPPGAGLIVDGGSLECIGCANGLNRMAVVQEKISSIDKR